ncbi:hypothetical protein ACGFXC_10495 [Streptomyces sp. NPDC048507]|uniref:hypothetical protein n=1 Tax=Streptomyces sp. NPDC048507 TaxID=3365560 RepID=UPI00371388B4
METTGTPVEDLMPKTLEEFAAASGQTLAQLARRGITEQTFGDYMELLRARAMKERYAKLEDRLIVKLNSTGILGIQAEMARALTMSVSGLRKRIANTEARDAEMLARHRARKEQAAA